MEIVDRLAAAGPLPIKDLARMIGAQPSALYHHMMQLAKVGLVIVKGHQVVQRKREAIYATRAPRVRLYRALQDPANAAIMMQITDTITRQMSRDFRQGTKLPHARPGASLRTLGFSRLLASPDSQTLRRINRLLTEIQEMLFASTDERHDPIAFAWVMAPVRRASIQARSRVPLKA
jgi:DNA-binding transcriptional ArsR family regulator